MAGTPGHTYLLVGSDSREGEGNNIDGLTGGGDIEPGPADQRHLHRNRLDLRRGDCRHRDGAKRQRGHQGLTHVILP